MIFELLILTKKAEVRVQQNPNSPKPKVQNRYEKEPEKWSRGRRHNNIREENGSVDPWSGPRPKSPKPTKSDSDPLFVRSTSSTCYC